MSEDVKKDYVAAPSPTEQVLDEAPPKPRRARVEDAVEEPEPDTMPEAMGETMGQKLERKRDYLDGFLQKKPESVGASGPGGALQEAVISALKEIYDPEIPVNIYDLGLIYTIDIKEDNAVNIVMTLTAPGCPVAGEMPGWVADAVEPLPGVKQVDVEMTFEPQWGMDMMSDEARLELGFM